MDNWGTHPPWPGRSRSLPPNSFLPSSHGIRSLLAKDASPHRRRRRTALQYPRPISILAIRPILCQAESPKTRGFADGACPDILANRTLQAGQRGSCSARLNTGPKRICQGSFTHSASSVVWERNAPIRGVRSTPCAGGSNAANSRRPAARRRSTPGQRIPDQSVPSSVPPKRPALCQKNQSHPADGFSGGLRGSRAPWEARRAWMREGLLPTLLRFHGSTPASRASCYGRSLTPWPWTKPWTSSDAFSRVETSG